MAKKTYSEQYRSPKWQKKRLEVMELAGFECVACGSKDKTLNVHHLVYHKGREVWDYENGELQVLCEECHETRHAYQKYLAYGLGQLTNEEMAQVVGYADGLFFHKYLVHKDENADLGVWDDENYCQGVIDAWWGWNDGSVKPSAKEIAETGVLTPIHHNFYGEGEIPSQNVIETFQRTRQKMEAK